MLNLLSTQLNSLISWKEILAQQMPLLVLICKSTVGLKDDKETEEMSFLGMSILPGQHLAVLNRGLTGVMPFHQNMSQPFFPLGAGGACMG